MHRQDIRNYTRRLLGEGTTALGSNPSPSSYWSDDDLNDFINRGHEDVVVRGELLTCVSTTKSKAATLANLPTGGMYPQPQDVLIITRVFFYDPTMTQWTELAPMSMQEADRRNGNWFTTLVSSGQIPSNWIVNGQMYHLYPAPILASLTDNIMIWGIQTPPPMTADWVSGSPTPADTPQIPLGYHEAIAYAAAIRALRADKESASASRLIPQYEREVARMTSLAKNQQARKGQRMRLQDLRDFQVYPSEWRWPSGA